jgi:dTDP-glucose 4,6-dehydratase
MKILVTGAAGFIGSTFVRVVLERDEDEIVVLDKLTYAGRRENLQDVEDRIEFVEGAIEDRAVVREVTSRPSRTWTARSPTRTSLPAHT